MSEEEKDNSQNKSNNNNNVNNSINNLNIINQNNKTSSPQNSRTNSKKSKSSNNNYSSPFSNHSSKSKSKSRSKSKYSHSHSKSDSYSYSSDSRSRSRSRDRRRKIGIPQIFVTKLSSRVTKKDLDKEFGKYGDIRNLNLKKGYAFIEYYDKEDAKYAIRELDNKKLFGQQQRIVVEEAKGSKRERERERRRDRERDRDRDYYYRRRSGPKKTDICFNCGKEGHWANECSLPRKER